MEANPYTFDEKNPRLVTLCDTGEGKMMPLERSKYFIPYVGAFYLGSVYMFYKKRFRIDGDFVKMLGFSAGACPASIIFANSCCGSTELEAALLNNEKETGR